MSSATRNSANACSESNPMKPLFTKLLSHNSPIKDKVQKAQKPVPKFAEAGKNPGVKKEPAAPAPVAPVHPCG